MRGGGGCKLPSVHVRNTLSTAGNSMSSSERLSPEPLSKKRLPQPYYASLNQEPKRTHKAKKSHEQHQRIFWTIRGVTESLPSKTRVLGQIAQKVHLNVWQNLCHTVSLWYLFGPQLSLRTKSESCKGGWKTQGRGTHTIKSLPETAYHTFPPPHLFIPPHFLRGNRHRPAIPLFEASKTSFVGRTL